MWRTERLRCSASSGGSASSHACESSLARAVRGRSSSWVGRASARRPSGRPGSAAAREARVRVLVGAPQRRGGKPLVRRPDRSLRRRRDGGARRASRSAATRPRGSAPARDADRPGARGRCNRGRSPERAAAARHVVAPRRRRRRPPVARPTLDRGAVVRLASARGVRRAVPPGETPGRSVAARDGAGASWAGAPGAGLAQPRGAPTGARGPARARTVPAARSTDPRRDARQPALRARGGPEAPRGGAADPRRGASGPRGSGRLLGTRVARLSPSERRLLLAVALSRSLRPRQLELLAEPGTLERAVAAGALVVDDDGARASHPLLAAAAVGGSSPDERRELHRELAEVVEDERGAHASSGAGGYEPDVALAATVASAAGDARPVAPPQAAAELAEHALRLTPPDTAGGKSACSSSRGSSCSRVRNGA